ncbi:MAG TPA: helix-turn-helix domain-containing protein [Candidatus Dormibacteraeota bacterium]
MSPRAYHLGRRQPSIERTATAILTAARSLLTEREAGDVSVAEIARRAGVSRLTVYNRFGSRAGVLNALTVPQRPSPPAALAPRDEVTRLIAEACARWSAEPALYRHLPAASGEADAERNRTLAERLASSDELRPGCSIKEAEDVIGAVTSFDLFDRLHGDGRRSASGAAEILGRFASTVLA